MEGESVKNDIKTIFLITNTINALVAGLYPLSLSVSILLVEVYIAPLIFLSILGLPVVCLITLGYYAAIKDDKKLLNSYSIMMGLLTVAEWVSMVVVFSSDAYITVYILFHTGVTLGAITSADVLAHYDPTQSEQKPSRFSYCLKISGCVFVVIVVTGLFVNYFI